MLKGEKRNITEGKFTSVFSLYFERNIVPDCVIPGFREELLLQTESDEAQQQIKCVISTLIYRTCKNEIRSNTLSSLAMQCIFYYLDHKHTE
jgi:hypothetical protein